MAQSFFSISSELVALDRPLDHDLYINSSGLESREKFVCIQRKGQTMTKQDLKNYLSKYYRVYVSEDERSLFLRSLVAVKGATIAQKTTVLKDSAIHHLKNLFEKDSTPESLGKALVDCREVVEGMIDVLEEYDIDQLRDLIANLSFHDFYTYDHSVNVSMYCIMIYKLLEPDGPRSMIIQAGMGGLLHDLGKIRIPTHILNKTDKLSEEEFAEIRKHPGMGCDLLAHSKSHLPSGIDADLIGRVIHEHHENFDGTGYPRKISGETIHLLSRVTAIADFFDAITTKRSYHEPLKPEDALAIMSKSEGKKLDPELLHVFMEAARIGKIHRLTRKELPDDFDPCQPHSFLPLVDSDPRKEGLARGFGQIKIVATARERQGMTAPRGGGIKIIDPETAGRKTGKKPVKKRLAG